MAGPLFVDALWKLAEIATLLVLCMMIYTMIVSQIKSVQIGKISVKV